MHPTSAFHWTDRDAMLAFVHQRAFATIFATIEGRMVVAQAPMIVEGTGTTSSNARCLLHLSRANPLSMALPIRVVAVVGGADAYVSPDWYAEADQVPTWNYVSVEIEGELTATDEQGLRRIVEAQSSVFERRIGDKKPWTTDKMTPEVLESKLRGIRGGVLEIHALRGTRKLSQNKSAADRHGVADALSRSSDACDRAMAELVKPA